MFILKAHPNLYSQKRTSYLITLVIVATLHAVDGGGYYTSANMCMTVQMVARFPAFVPVTICTYV